MYNSSLYNSVLYNELGTQRQTSSENYVLEIQYTGTFIDTGSNVVSFSEQNRVSYGKHLYDTKSTVLKFFVLDGSCTLTGDYVLAPESEEDAKHIEFGWMSQRVCDSNGYFQTAPAISIEFIKTVFYNVLIAFYPVNNEYATEFVIKLYNNGTKVYEQLVTDNANAILNIQFAEGIEATKIELAILRWSKSNTIAKVSELWTGYTEAYRSEMIINLQIMKELKEFFLVQAATELQITLVNDGRFAKNKPLYKLLKPNRFLRLYHIDDSGNEEILFEGFTAKFKVREYDVQILAYSPFANATDLSIDDAILQNKTVSEIANSIVALCEEFNLPWNISNNVSRAELVQYHVLQTNIRRSIEEFALACNVRVRERNNVFVIGDERQNVIQISELECLDFVEDRDFKTPTVLHVRYSELVRQQRSETRQETVQANQERLIQFQHGFLLSDAIVNVTLSSSKADYRIYRGKYVTSVKIIAGGEDVTATITVQLDELALNERNITAKNDEAMREWGRVTSTIEIPFTTEANARQIAQEILQFNPDVFTIKIPLRYDVDIDDIVQINDTNIYVLKVTHNVSAFEQFTQIEGRAV